MRLSIRTAVFSFVLSVMLWLYITLQGEYEVTVPVELQVRVPSDQWLDSPLPGQLDVRLRGSGWNLLNALYLDRSMRITVEVTSRQRQGQLTESDLRSGFRSPAQLRLIGIEPQSIEYRLSSVSQKKVPISPDIHFATADGYLVSRPLVLVPDSVLLIGSRSVLDTIRGWQTQSLVRQNVHRSIVELVELERSPILRVLPERVLVKAVVQQIAEATYYDVPVVLEPGPATTKELIPSHVTVTIRGGLEDIERLLEQAEIPITVRVLRTQLASGAEMITPVVNAPAWIRDITVQPQFLLYRRLRQ
ncbi:MAG: hypothetical protein N2663_02435 [Chlorobi bacterium]|nr:hypothetical protein [Chlorobiota bacterium]